MTHWLFITAFVNIAMRAFQQLNVQHGRYMWVPPATATMAVCEVLTITAVVKADSLWAVVPLTLGGIFGCWLSMWTHKKLRERSTK